MSGARLFPGQLASKYRSYRRLIRVLHQLGIPARASRLTAWRDLAREAPPGVLADALGVSLGRRPPGRGGLALSSPAVPAGSLFVGAPCRSEVAQ